MDTKGEKSSEVNKLAGMKSKSKDDESLNPNPLHDTEADSKSVQVNAKGLTPYVRILRQNQIQIDQSATRADSQSEASTQPQCTHTRSISVYRVRALGRGML